MDTGNVWLMRNNEDHPGGAFRLRNLGRELALGTGFGFRYDLDFIVVRFDVGVGIHAPYDTGKSGYYNMPRFWKSLGYHFAIGYPFCPPQLHYDKKNERQSDFCLSVIID